ncbi:hypothetical protein K0H71_20190 [Bacillus sp. IITD106]|nr:hypothetical protein [Bacillus sp. IITD106]
MKKKYVGAWAFFENDYQEGLDKAFARYRDAGITHIMYGGIAHAFDVNEEFYKNTSIDPHIQINYEKNEGDLFGTKSNLINSDYNEISRLANQYGINIELNITPGVSDVIVEANPEIAVVDIDGNRSKHWMCPSNNNVREYFYGRTKDILTNNKGIREVELDVVSLNVYDPMVVPDWVSPELSPLAQLAAGNCFCDKCVEKAVKAGLDIESIKTEIKAINKEATILTYEQFRNMTDTIRGSFDIVRFLMKHPKLLDWLNFRGKAVDDFVIEINKVVKGINPDILLSCDLVAPSFSWTLGQVYRNQPAITDITKLMLYHKRIGSFEAKPLKRVQNAIPEIKDEELLDQYYRLKGFSGPNTFKGLEEEGIGSENVFYEVRKAKLEVGTKHKIVAGLVGDAPATPEDVKEAVKMAYKGGADGYMLHLWYGDAPVENTIAFGEQLRELGEI